MTKMLCNIIENPGEDKFRKVRVSNPKFASKVYDIKGASDFFSLVGFRDNVEEGFIVLPATADLDLLRKGVDALAAQAAARIVAEEQKSKADEEASKRAKKERELKAKQEADKSKFDVAVASISAATGDIAEEEEVQLEAIEAFMDSKPELKS